jgi:hypothetical protein
MSSTESAKVIGVIFPLFQEHIRRFFDEGRTVFVKFAANRPTRLKMGSRLFFYQSKGLKEIVGEARIVNMSWETAEEAIAAYGDRLFLTPTELRQYAGNRSAKRMLVLVLDSFKEYSIPLKLDKSTTMAGRYMTQNLFQELKSAT